MVVNMDLTCVKIASGFSMETCYIIAHLNVFGHHRRHEVLKKSSVQLIQWKQESMLSHSRTEMLTFAFGRIISEKFGCLHVVIMIIFLAMLLVMMHRVRHLSLLQPWGKFSFWVGKNFAHC